MIGAIVAVNATGDIVDWTHGKIIAGARREDGTGFVNLSEGVRKQMADRLARKTTAEARPSLTHTTIGVIATNVEFNKAELARIAQVANTGAAKVINPYHTPEDGDVLYAVLTRRVKLDGGPSQRDVAMAGIMAAEVAGTAIMRAAKMATSIEGGPAYRDYMLRLP